MVVNKEGAHNVVYDYSGYFVSTTVLFLIFLWHLICHIMFPNLICIFLYFTLVHGLYILVVLIIIYFICTSNQSGKFQVKDMNVSLEEISTQNGPFNFYSNSMSSCVS